MEVTGGELLRTSSCRRVRGVSIDSRGIRRGELFVALKGEQFDGHRFVLNAVEQGASGAIINRRGWTAVARALRVHERAKSAESPFCDWCEGSALGLSGVGRPTIVVALTSRLSPSPEAMEKRRPRNSLGTSSRDVGGP